MNPLKQLTSDPLCWVRLLSGDSITYSRFTGGIASTATVTRYTGTQLAAMLGCLRTCEVNNIAIDEGPTIIESVLKEMLRLMSQPLPTFPVGTRVQLSHTYSNRGEYGTVVKGTHTSKDNVYVAIPGHIQTIDYSPEGLLVVSEEEFARNVTLQVGDTVRLRQLSAYAGERAKIRSIEHDLLTVEFNTYDPERAFRHKHKPGEPYGYVWTTAREWFELVGNPSESGRISTNMTSESPNL